MSERFFRMVLGAGLIILLYLKLELFVYAYMGLVMFEGVTNLRIPTLVSRIRYGENFARSTNASDSRFAFDAERVLRMLVATFLFISYILFPEELWFFPWFVGFMLLMAGVTNICPMVMTLKWLGFR